MLWLNTLFYLLLILVAAEIFINALEHLGESLGISEGVTGSVFAAVGTALPETVVPLLAIMGGGNRISSNLDIGTGAILGAPLMLSTLTLCLMSIVVWRKRGLRGNYTPERTGLTRDLNTFLIAFSLACAALYLPTSQTILRAFIAVSLVLIYFIYVMLTFRASKQLTESGHGTATESPLLLSRMGFPTHLLSILLQLGIGLSILIVGAQGFITTVQQVAVLFGIPVLLLSMLIVPIATELPEKINSIIWIRRNKDTLAFGNITGAMVFQGTLLPAIGITLTSWSAQPIVILSMLLTLTGASWLRWCLARGTLQVWQLAANGALYGAYLFIATHYFS